jgi:hypothetical protein
MGPYDAEWQRYRRLRRLSLLFLVPFCMMPWYLFSDSPPARPLLLPIAMVLGFIGVGAWFMLNYFRCPRCGKLFAITWWYSLSIFALKCVNCGLRKFSDGDAL